MAEGASVGQVPQALGAQSPGEELLQMHAHAPNARDPLLHPRSSPSARAWRFHAVPGADERWRPSHGHPVL